MSLSIKVYHKKCNTSITEIRRFCVPPDVSDFLLLKRKVSEVFPTLYHGNFVIHWKDSDGDDICLSSDEELEEALRHVTGGVLKIYIKLTSLATGKSHGGVSCSNCQGLIYGTRYKYCHCSDYNLCRCCENQGIHGDHDLLKIVKSNKWEEPKECDVNKHCVCSVRPEHQSERVPSSASSSGCISAESQNQFMGKDAVNSFVQYGINLSKTFTKTLANAMNPFDDLDEDFYGEENDMECNIDHNDDDVMAVENERNKQRAKEFKHSMFKDSVEKQPEQNKPNELHPSYVNEPIALRAKVGFPGPIHPDPKIAKALIQMLSMGFSNEENKLIQLLEENNGKIDLVIESLNKK